MSRRMKRWFLASAILVFALVGAIVITTIATPSRQLAVKALEVPEPRPGFAERLAKAVTFRTISNVDMKRANLQAFADFHTWLSDTFPDAHAKLEREAIPPCSVIYTWRGSDETRKPVLLLSHLDVVPVEDAHLDRWTHPPFDGVIADDHIWGRGTLDDKVGVVGLLESVDALAKTDWKPSRTLYLGFGCDEEVGGREGAARIAAEFKARDVEFEWVLDEGHIITRGIFPGVEAPVAFIGLAEKGFVTLNLDVESEGGHSSMPPKQTAVGVLAQAVQRVEAHPMPASVSPPVAEMFKTLAPESPLANRIVFSNLWITRAIVLGILEKKKTTNATIRTTTAATVFHGGIQENVLPKLASAKINFRILPGETIEDVVAHVTDVIDDERVKITVPREGFNSNPSPIASSTASGYITVAQAIRDAFGAEYVVAPSLTIGGTDSRHFEKVSENTYRFLPVELKGDDTKRIHGVDERISISNYQGALRFYMHIIRQAGA